MIKLNYPLISVIIPIYNVELYLEEAVKSVCIQTYKNIEIILVDDGSVDKSSIICDDLAMTDDRIKVIHKKNGGLSSARNVGIAIATGEYLFFMDSDDFIEKNTFEILYNYFLLDKKFGIVSAPCFYSFYNHEKYSIYNEKWNIKNDRIISYNDFCVATLTQKCCHSACCKLYKRELFTKISFREGKKNEDTLFMFDLSDVMKELRLNMIEVPHKLYYYRINEGSITRNSFHPIQIDIIDNIQDMLMDASDPIIINTLYKLYYKELIYFYSYLITRTDLIQNDCLLKTKDDIYYELHNTSIFKILKHVDRKSVV